MRIARAVAGVLLLLVALPMLIAGGTLWEASRHRDGDGAFRARVEALHTDEAAIVVWDLDGLLRREAPFARGGRTSLRVDVPGRFVGLAAREDVERYLDPAGWLAVDRVRLARGPLPVDARTVPAPRTAIPDAAANLGGAAGGAASDQARLAPPREQLFWRVYATGDQRRPLSFPPSSVRGERLALVIMNDDGAPAVGADITVAVAPAWLDRTTWGVLILGTMLLLLGSLAVAWPRPRRDIVYVVEPDQLPQVTAHLGLSNTAPAPARAAPTPAVAAATALAAVSTKAGSTKDGSTKAGSPKGGSPKAKPAAPVARPAPPAPPVTVRLEWPPAQASRRTATPIPAPESH
jgi:hypothetical protein